MFKVWDPDPFGYGSTGPYRARTPDGVRVRVAGRRHRRSGGHDGVMDTRSLVGGVLLAAGGGTRFADPSHKLRAELNGRPLFRWSIDAMIGAGLDHLAVVTGAVDLSDLVPAGVERLANPAWREGQATSLAVAVTWATAHRLSALVVGLGDQPGITSGAWTKVAATDRTPVAIATYGGRRGHPVRLARAIWARLPVTGDRGAGELIGGSPELVTEVACEGDASDVDTVEDLTRWR